MTIFDTLLLTTPYDKVAVFDQDFNQVFPDARSIKAVVKEEAKVMQHPLETGATTTDHRIILPVEIELSVVLQSPNYQDTYNQIRQLYLNATLLIVQTRSGIYYNQLISSMPHEENPDMYDALTVALTLTETQFATTTYDFSPKNVNQSSTIDRGNQQSLPPNPGVSQSILKDAFVSVTDFFRNLI